MRRKIPCKVIRSIPLVDRREALRDARGSNPSDPNIICGGFAKTNPPAMIRIYTDDDPVTGMLDLYA